MSILIRMLMLMTCCLTAWSLETNRVFTVGASDGVEGLHAVYPLSDGTVLLGGRCDDLSWLPAGVPVTTLDLAGASTDSHATNIAIILHCSGDLAQVLRVVRFPATTVEDVFRIRGTEVPGAPTGTLYISGKRAEPATTGSKGRNFGYYIAKLDGNFVDAVPSAVSWLRDIYCWPRQASGSSEDNSEYGARQIWDVDSQGRVYYTYGAHIDIGWAGLRAFNADGSDRYVPAWLEGNETDGSQIPLKAGRGAYLRSQTAADFTRYVDDGNGGWRRGARPDDFFFAADDTVGDNGRGYTGTANTSKPTALPGGLVVDRRSDRVYFSYAYQSSSTGPDFTPNLVAMEADGSFRWYRRPFPDFIDENGNGVFDWTDKDGDGVFDHGEADEPYRREPDQYADGLAIDYAQNRIVGLFRSHGNQPVSFYKGNAVVAATSNGFQNGFSGNNGNIHISWLGSWSLGDGQLQAVTWVADLNDDAAAGNTFTSGLLAGWGNPNSGWPSLNSCRWRRSKLHCDGDGNVYLALSVSGRAYTTSNAHGQQPKLGEGTSVNTDVLRVYSGDLSTMRYSSQLHDKAQADGHSGSIWGFAPCAGGVYVVGDSSLDDVGAPKGQVLASAVPTWGKATSSDVDGIAARLFFDGAAGNSLSLRRIGFQVERAGVRLEVTPALEPAQGTYGVSDGRHHWSGCATTDDLRIEADITGNL